MEIWKDIKGYEGYYQVSSLGNVKTVGRLLKNSSYKKSRLLKPGLNEGYRGVNLCKNGIHKSIKIHRLVAGMFIPNPENKTHVNHKNSIRGDNRIENLEWVTHKENMFLSRTSGKRPKTFGEKHNRSKLTNTKVLIIRKVYADMEFSQQKLAKAFNISVTTVANIIRRKTWPHI